MLPISVRPVTVFDVAVAILLQLQLSMMLQLRLSVFLYFSMILRANVAAVAVISHAALVNDAALEVVNVCCS